MRRRVTSDTNKNDLSDFSNEKLRFELSQWLSNKIKFGTTSKAITLRNVVNHIVKSKTESDMFDIFSDSVLGNFFMSIFSKMWAMEAPPVVEVQNNAMSRYIYWDKIIAMDKKNKRLYMINKSHDYAYANIEQGIKNARKITSNL